MTRDSVWMNGVVFLLICSLAALIGVFFSNLLLSSSPDSRSAPRVCVQLCEDGGLVPVEVTYRRVASDYTCVCAFDVSDPE